MFVLFFCLSESFRNFFKVFKLFGYKIALFIACANSTLLSYLFLSLIIFLNINMLVFPLVKNFRWEAVSIIQGVLSSLV